MIRDHKKTALYLALAILWILFYQSPVLAQQPDSIPAVDVDPGSISTADAAENTVQSEVAETAADPAMATEPSEPPEVPESSDPPVETEVAPDPEQATVTETTVTPEATDSAEQPADSDIAADSVKAAESAGEVAAPVSKAAGAAGAVGAVVGAAAGAAAVSQSDLLSMYEKQQQQLDEQLKQIEAQRKLLESMQSQQAEKIQEQKAIIAKQAEQIETQRQSMQSMQTQIDQIAQVKAQNLSEDDIEMRSRLETLESSIKASEESASTVFDEESFPNSTTIPGTSAAMRFGGFVKMNIVETFNPLDSLDRFIVGTIPVPQQSQSPRTSMTVSQSRLNWEVRDRTKMGVMRAFIEADFAGDGDTFRLRHAYGQFRDVLAGKTWTVFMDVDASPEEIDFEGINGRVNVRQPQIRYFPKLGDDWDLMLSLEDPSPEITGGTAISQWPDIVASARKTWFERWHIKTSLVFRQITGSWDEDLTGETEDQVTGWGVSFSGKTATQFWNKLGIDNIMFQFNAGKGIGHYINDLDTVGGEDAVFDDDGQLETLPIFAGYVAYQHWWKDNFRSTINLSWVDIQNKSFESPEAYQSTFRGAVNLIWSPVARIDLGGEAIWGKRENKNGENATAAQIQASVKYRF